MVRVFAAAFRQRIDTARLIAPQWSPEREALTDMFIPLK
jgi:hypothetical protein